MLHNCITLHYSTRLYYTATRQNLTVLCIAITLQCVTVQHNYYTEPNNPIQLLYITKQYVMALYITTAIPCQTVHCNYSALLDFTLPYTYNKIQNGTPLCLTQTLLYKTKPHITTTRLY